MSCNFKKYQKKSPVYAITIDFDFDKIKKFMGQRSITIAYTNTQQKNNICIDFCGERHYCSNGDYLCYSKGIGYFVVDKETFEKDYEEIKDGKQ